LLKQLFAARFHNLAKGEKTLFFKQELLGMRDEYNLYYSVV
jgi:hypothetical protein